MTIEHVLWGIILWSALIIITVSVVVEVVHVKRTTYKIVMAVSSIILGLFALLGFILWLIAMGEYYV